MWGRNFRSLEFTFETPLAVASEFGLLNDFEYFIALEEETESKTRRQIFGDALAVAASKGQERVVELLLAKGTNVNYCIRSSLIPGLPMGKSIFSKSERFLSALQAAALNGHKRVVQMLLERDADVNLQIEGGGYGSALQAAAKKGSESIV